MRPRFFSLTDRGQLLHGNLPKTRHRQRSQTRNRLVHTVLHCCVLIQENITKRNQLHITIAWTSTSNSQWNQDEKTDYHSLTYVYMWMPYLRNSTEKLTMTVNHNDKHQQNLSRVVSKRAYPAYARNTSRSPGTDLMKTRTQGCFWQGKSRKMWTPTPLPKRDPKQIT